MSNRILRGVSSDALAVEHSVSMPATSITATAVEKTVDADDEGSRQAAAIAFTQVRPRGDKDPASHTVSLAFVVEEGPRVYIERINMRGNTATRDYVIRREFDIGEGDAYNKALIDKAERRLNSLGFFKKVKITNEQGSAPDRVIINVDVEEQSTGIVLGLGRLFDHRRLYGGSLGVPVQLHGPRRICPRLAVSAGQYAQGVELNYTEPFFLDQRLAAGFDLYTKISRRLAIRLLFELGHRRHAASRHSDHRRHHARAALHAV